MHRWAFFKLGITSLVSYVYPQNLGSRRVLEHLGASNTGMVTILGNIQCELWQHRTPG